MRRVASRSESSRLAVGAALMRPVSVAGIFAGLCGLLAGVLSVLRMIAVSASPVPPGLVALATAEALVLLFLVLGRRTVAWLCVAMGLRDILDRCGLWP